MVSMLAPDSDATDAEKWLRALIREFGIGFHPDTPPSEYVDPEGRPLPSQDVDALEASLDLLFEVLGDESPYEMCLDEAHRMYGESLEEHPHHSQCSE